MRREHLIRPTRTDALPRQVVCVQADARPAPVGGAPSCERWELTGWRGVAWRYRLGEPCGEVFRAGPDARSFWLELDRALHRGTLTWVFSHDAYRVMTLLGFWGMLETKEVSLYGRDEREPAAVDKRAVPEVQDRANDAVRAEVRMPDGGLRALRGELPCGTEEVRAAREGVGGRGVGYAVLEDPPTIVQFRRAGRPGLVKWVDVRNYTALDVREVRGADGTLRQVVPFVLGMVACAGRERMGPLANTASGQAWSAWRRSHYTHPVLVHCHEQALVLERQAYVGGRCEVFRFGELPPPVYHLDFRAHYASCYEHASLPVSLEWYGEMPGGSSDLSVIDPACTIADVMIDTDAPDYPAVRRLKRGTHVEQLKPGERPPEDRSRCLCVYPTGRFRTVLCGPEVYHAVQRGRILRVYRAARYHTGPALRSLAGALRELRCRLGGEGREDLVLWVKQMQVGVVGRFGMHGRKWVLDGRIRPVNPYETWWRPGDGGVAERWRSLAWEPQREVVERDGPESCCAVAAWITSLARVKLLEALEVAGHGDAFYTDTDSVWTSERGFDRLRASGHVGGGEPGLLRVVRVHTCVEFYGYKHYRADERHVCAGRPAECVGGDEQPDRYRQRERARGGVSGGVTPDVRSALVGWRRSAPYLHGQVGPGGAVKPHEFWEE